MRMKLKYSRRRGEEVAAVQGKTAVMTKSSRSSKKDFGRRAKRCKKKKKKEEKKKEKKKEQQEQEKGRGCESVVGREKVIEGNLSSADDVGYGVGSGDR
ncbi:hypothetical protein LY78DRAFT_326531 [Colletotrichum sublineola]|nr:hypothetical protein LY78DRAFT_326531 [Colletotrichum sublineola]